MTQSDGPLTGIRVADFTTVVMGPLASRMLADMGADVIRVEAPGGDIIRDYAPMRNPKMSAFTININRNKRSVVLDMKSDSGRQAAHHLITTCDVFVTNHRRSALERLGLDEETVRRLRPDIVYCISNGFGSDGPNADWAAYDDVIQAASGLASMFAWNGDEPVFVPSIVADKITGLHMAYAIAAALHGRALAGEGETIEVPMAETMAAFNLIEHLGGQTFDPPRGEFSYGRIRTPHRRPRRTADGWIVILPYSSKAWDLFFEFGERPDLRADERFATAADRVANADALYGSMDAIVITRSTTEWMAFCNDNSIPASPVVELEEVGDDPHFSAVGLLVDHEHPSEGNIKYVRDPIQLGGKRATIRRHAPALGEHTEEVFTELGYSTEQLREL